MQPLLLAALLAAVPAFAAQKTVTAPVVAPAAPSARGASAPLPSAPVFTAAPASPLSAGLPAAAAAVPFGHQPAAQAKAKQAKARVAVIGGGIAGLAAVHELAKHSVVATIYESEPRVGGRMKTRSGPGGLVVDAGAEFVSSTHDALLSLMAELGVKTVKRRSGTKRKTFFYEGRAFEDKAFQRRVFREAAPALEKLVADELILRRAIAAKDLDTLRRFDAKSLGDYLDELSAPKILRAYIRAVVDSEAGRDHRELSSVVLFECLSIDLESKRFAPLPDEDEVFKIAGGAGAITAALEQRHADAIALSHRLTAIDSDDGRLFTLTFATPEGERVVRADHVILALPPPALKAVRVRVPGWTEKHRKSVESVEYGRHLKLTLFFKDRPWRKRGHAGAGFIDEGYAFWESSEGQRTKAGSITFLGRAPGGGGKTVGELASGFIEKLAHLFPGLRQSLRGVDVETWARSYPFADGPGDPYGFVLTWLGRTAFTKFDAAPLGNLRWAGDLFSGHSPAYMSGAVETARQAALSVVAALDGAAKK